MADADYYANMASRTQVGMDGRNPTVRLSVLSYLLEAGYTPKEEGFMSMLDGLIAWLTSDLDSYLEMVRAMEPPSIVAEEPVKDAYKVLRDGGYM